MRVILGSTPPLPLKDQQEEVIQVETWAELFQARWRTAGMAVRGKHFTDASPGMYSVPTRCSRRLYFALQPLEP